MHAQFVSGVGKQSVLFCSDQTGQQNDHVEYLEEKNATHAFFLFYVCVMLVTHHMNKKTPHKN